MAPAPHLTASSCQGAAPGLKNTPQKEAEPGPASAFISKYFQDTTKPEQYEPGCCTASKTAVAPLPSGGPGPQPQCPAHPTKRRAPRAASGHEQPPRRGEPGAGVNRESPAGRREGGKLSGGAGGYQHTPAHQEEEAPAAGGFGGTRGPGATLRDILRA